MSAVDEIQAAIDKLTKLKAESTPGLWRRFLTDPRYAVINSTELNVTPTIKATNADLIVTLHATIDAQLSILRAASVDEDEAREHWASVGKPHLRGPAKIAPINMAALDLARAINGGTK